VCAKICHLGTHARSKIYNLGTEESYSKPANELARLGDAGVGALCRFANASGRHPASSTVAGITGMYCAFSSIISSHHQYIIIISLVTNLPSSIHDSLHISTFSRALSVGRARRPSRGHVQKRDGTFSSLAGGHQNGRFNPFTRRRTDTARLTRAQPILLGGLEQGLSPGPIYHLIPDELSLLTSISKQIHMSEEGDPARGL
jgi:hypothetical protein